MLARLLYRYLVNQLGIPEVQVEAAIHADYAQAGRAPIRLQENRTRGPSSRPRLPERQRRRVNP